MNPLTNVKNIAKLSEQELQSGPFNIKTSWHSVYKDSAWLFIGGLPFEFSEGDVIAIFSQYGEIVNINLVRDKKTGKSKGFGFLCYEDQRSTILAVDNLNGINFDRRIIRVDHVEEYKIPKEFDGITDEMKVLYDEGCAPRAITEEQTSSSRRDRSRSPKASTTKHKKSKKDKKHKKKSKKNKNQRDSSEDSDDSGSDRRQKSSKNEEYSRSKREEDSPDRRQRRCRDSDSEDERRRRRDREESRKKPSNSRRRHHSSDSEGGSRYERRR